MANPVLERKGGTQLLRKVAVWLGAVINNQISITLRMKKTKLQYNQKLGFRGGGRTRMGSLRTSNLKWQYMKSQSVKEDQSQVNHLVLMVKCRFSNASNDLLTNMLYQ
jgi:hypothetical protein